MNEDKQIQSTEQLTKKIKQEISADYRAKEYFINRLTIDEVIGNIVDNELKLAIIEANQFYQNDKSDFKLNLALVLNSLPKEVWFDE